MRGRTAVHTPGLWLATGLLLIILLLPAVALASPRAQAVPPVERTDSRAMSFDPHALSGGNSFDLHAQSYEPGNGSWAVLANDSLGPGVSSVNGASSWVHTGTSAEPASVSVVLVDLSTGATIPYLTGSSYPFANTWDNISLGSVVSLNATASYAVVLSALEPVGAGDAVGENTTRPALDLAFNRSTVVESNLTQTGTLTTTGNVLLTEGLVGGSLAAESLGVGVDTSPIGGSSGWTLFVNLTLVDSTDTRTVYTRDLTLTTEETVLLSAFPEMSLNPADSYVADALLTLKGSSGITATDGPSGLPALTVTAAAGDLLSGSVASGYLPLPVTYRAAPLFTGATNVTEDFHVGNGTTITRWPGTSTAASATFDYGWNGTFHPWLNATVRMGTTQVDTAEAYLPGPLALVVLAPGFPILITSPSPAVGHATPSAPLTVAFNATFAVEPATGWTQQWVFGNGDSYDQVGAPPSQNYPTVGHFPVTLALIDPEGYAVAYPHPFHVVTGVYPIIRATYTVVDAGVEDSFTPLVVGGTSDYRGFTWAFGDGSLAQGNTTVHHAYTAPGTYTVNLTVEDAAGNVGIGNLTVVVRSALTVADTVLPATGPAPLLTELAADVDGGTTSLVGGPGGASILNATLVWRFGDGGTGTGPDLSHLYAFPRSYTLTLFVNDTGGSTVTISTSVVVTGSTPPFGWPTDRGPTSATGDAPGPGPASNHIENQTTFGNVSLRGLAEVPGGALVATLSNGTILGLDPTSLKVLWSEPFGAHTELSAPAVDGTTATVATLNGSSSTNVYALNGETGAPLWETTPGDVRGVDLGAAPVPDGNEILVATADGITALSLDDGAVDWQLTVPEIDTLDTPVISGTSLDVVTTGAIAQVNLATEGLSDITDGFAGGTPAASDGWVVLAEPYGVVAGVLAGGSEWETTLTGPTSTPTLPVAVADGRVLATDGLGPLQALSEVNGSRLWKTSFNATTAPVVAGDVAYVGNGSRVFAIDTATGATLWNRSLTGDPTGLAAVADGLLEVPTTSGALVALGDPPLSVVVSAPRHEAAANQSMGFVASVSGGLGTATMAWLFSDNATALGLKVTHTFASPGPAWAEAIAVDADGAESPAALVNLTILPPLDVTLVENVSSGEAPLPLSLTVVITGGDGRYGVPTVLATGNWTGTLIGSTDLVNVTTVGNTTFVATVTDTADDRSSSQPVNVSVSAPTPGAPMVTVTSAGPTGAQVVWTPTTIAAFNGTQVWVSTDGGASDLVAHFNASGVASYLLENLSLGADLNVSVSVTTSYGTSATSAGTDYTVPLVPPTLTIAPDAALPGQAFLNWTLPPVDHFSAFTLCLGGPIAPSPGVPCAGGTADPLGATAGVRSWIGPVLPNLVTTDLTLVVSTTTGSWAESNVVPFTPAHASPSLSVTIHDETANLSWTLPHLAGLATWQVCWNQVGSATTTCQANSTATTATTTSVVLPSGGTFDLEVLFASANGFVVTSSIAQVVAHAVGPPTVWYDIPLGPASAGVWVVVVILLLLILLLAALVWRERTEIPPFLGLPLPWDPLAPEPDDKARKKARADETPVHRHRRSHSHRHAAPSGSGTARPKAVRLGSGTAGTRSKKEDSSSEDEDEEDTPSRPPKSKEPRPSLKKEADDEDDDEEVKIAPSRHAPARSAPTEPKDRDDEDDEEDEEDEDDEPEGPVKGAHAAAPKPAPVPAAKPSKEAPAPKPRPKASDTPDEPTL